MSHEGFESGKQLDGVESLKTKLDGVVSEAAVIISKTGSTPILWFHIHTDFGFIKFEQVISPNTLEYVFDKIFWDCFGVKRDKAKPLLLSGDLSSLSETKVKIIPEFKAGRTPGQGYWKVKYMNPCFFRPKPAPPDMLAKIANMFDAPANQQAAGPRTVNTQAAQGEYDDRTAYVYTDDDVPF